VGRLCLFFLTKHNVLKASCVPIYKEAPNLVYLYTELFSITAHHRKSNLLRCAAEDISSSWVPTGKQLLKKLKLIKRPKNKSWANPQITSHKNSHDLRSTRPQIQEHRYLKFLTPLTPNLEKTVNFQRFK